ncbi:hypothetical protein EN836_13770 [Mesorhizobium sp. M1C.F.Ca.ET.193.01.1.1]|uniref:hypothetical protein n=1 Tax=unclassified Mesorhizobium TaxID=325217 RepID=UPI000FD6088D|nr:MULTISPECIES: hypothetical protein [unclassified Mesorhizobium]TGP83794.1 hypothetical protein EN864_33195 [bacterium M00.F.Ca.ET.221.01.1.1]TGT00283.1 hypothetical protein EN820_32505 [bacterium M00.F.Ca.ET.177.01.1.1]TGQ53688.1 hypothetical protein EN853_13775 [Mesorhizobium sp. M1C.F.Ca.ET.210.01.1.1]TGQ71720.1 hypothetical protein EN855_013780 [Mesorhizobium sp. M1C.F.Ca.ET.212.01.1.1]TGR08462.1 hypothetical protein EN847_13775 [Mesorhizobium sp. M1C.F.Ca.ET.204.01.1.1]
MTFGNHGKETLMIKQPWKTAVEIEELENRHYVRVIEDGAVSIKGFSSRADAKTFAHSERARLGINTPLKE